MSHRMPVVFVSHGAPDALLKSPSAVDCWRRIGEHVPQPAAILSVSSHWEARTPTVSLADAPETIYDFSGFSPVLYRMQYRAPGAPVLAGRVQSLLSAANIAVATSPDRGLDHGAWVPLTAMYPKADVPVAQLSLVWGKGPGTHLELGRALAPLRDEGVLIMASGAITHNFNWLDWRSGEDADPLAEAKAFAEWVAARVGAKDVEALLAYRLAPHGALAHPTEEHFMPLFVALGAAADDAPQRLHPRYSYGGLAMDAYMWSQANPNKSPMAQPQRPTSPAT